MGDDLLTHASALSGEDASNAIPLQPKGALRTRQFPSGAL